MIEAVEPKTEKHHASRADGHRHRKRTDWRRELERDEQKPVETKDQLLRAANDKVNALKLKIGNSSYHAASMQRSMRDGGKSFATAYSDARAHVAQLLKELQTLRNEMGEGGVTIDVGHAHDHHELEGLIEEAHHMERLASFASVRAGIHILKHHHHHDHYDHHAHAQGHQELHRNMALLEHDLQVAESHPYPGVRTLDEMEQAVEKLAPEMEKLGAKPAHTHGEHILHEPEIPAEAIR